MSETSRKTLKILIVDDSPAVRTLYVNLVGDLFRHICVSCTVLGDGAAAAEELKSNPAYDLIISDENMPKMRGRELVNWIRRQPELATIPVLMISGEDEQLFSELLAQGVIDFYLPKGNLNLSAFQSIVSNALAAPKALLNSTGKN